MIEQFTSPVAVNNSQEPWLVGEGVVVSGGVAIPSLDFDFITGGLPGTVTFTRASNATQFNASGNLVYAPNNAIRNNTMQGAVAGTPGTLPTNWSVSNLGTLTRQVVGTGTVNGVTYIDLRFSGTTSTTQLSIRLEPNGTLAVPASNGQTWTISMWSAIVGGGLTNITARGYSLLYWDNANGFLGGGGAGTFNSTATLMRSSETVTIAQVGTTFIQPQIYLVFNSGVAIDITLRIGLPQLEQGAFATSVIPTTTTALTRSADVASVNTLSPWYNASASTLYTEFNTPVPTTVSASAVTAGYDDGTANNRFSNFYTLNTSVVAANQTTGGTPNYTIVAASGLTLSNIQKQATRFQAGSYASSANGAAAVTDPFASAPPTVNTLRFGLRPSGTQANMWLRRVTVYPRGLSNAELVSITS